MAPEVRGEKKAAAARRLELSTIIFGMAEVHRLQRELEALEDFLNQSAIRMPGKQPQLPRTSRILETLAGNNNLNLLLEKDRETLKAFLQEVADRAPVIHVSFASDPSAAFTAKVVAWFRINVHPHTLVRLGLQPTLAAGCVVRTANKVFDFSLRNRFYEKREVLLTSVGRKDGSENADSVSAPPSQSQAVIPVATAAAQTPPIAEGQA